MVRITRREWFIGAGSLALTGCGRRTGSGFNGYALIATSGENSVAVADLSTFRLAREVSVGGSPERIASGPAASYVLTPQTGSVHAITHDLARAASCKVSDQLCGIRFASRAQRLFTLSSPTRELIEIDPRNLVLRKRWKLSGEPAHMAVSEDGAVAVASRGSGTIDFFDPQTGRAARAELDGQVGGIVFRPDGKLLLAANVRDCSITALAVPNLQTVVELPLAMRPDNLCFNADGGQLFITGPGMDGIAIVFPYLPLEVEQTILAGRDPGAMACSASPPYLLVASASGSDVYVLNIDDRKVLGIVEVGQRPSFVLATPDSQYALVLNENSGDMAIIRLSSIQQKLGNPDTMRGKSAAALFTMLPVGSKPVHAVIVPKLA